jgi:Fe2+ or Zn2+ uptake regulation protein
MIENEFEKKLEEIDQENIIFKLFSSKNRVKILYYLSQASENELNISRICKLTNSNHKTVEKNLRFFTQLEILQEKKFGRIRIFRLKIEDSRAYSIKKLFDVFSYY